MNKAIVFSSVNVAARKCMILWGGRWDSNPQQPESQDAASRRNFPFNHKDMPVRHADIDEGKRLIRKGATSCGWQDSGNPSVNATHTLT